MGAGKETMMNRKVYKFTCTGYSHNQDRSMNFFWGCNTFRTFHIFLSSLSLARPLFLYLFNRFEFSNFGDMERMKYRFWFFCPSSLREQLPCEALGTFLNRFDSNITLRVFSTDLASKWDSALFITINMRNIIPLTELRMHVIYYSPC